MTRKMMVTKKWIVRSDWHDFNDHVLLLLLLSALFLLPFLLWSLFLLLSLSLVLMMMMVTKKWIVRSDWHDFNHHVQEDRQRHQDCYSCKTYIGFVIPVKLLLDLLFLKNFYRICYSRKTPIGFVIPETFH